MLLDFPAPMAKQKANTVNEHRGQPQGWERKSPSPKQIAAEGSAGSLRQVGSHRDTNARPTFILSPVLCSLPPPTSGWLS